MALTVGLCVVLPGAPARSAPAPASAGLTADDVAAALHAKGYAAQISKDSDGDPMIRSGAEGVSFSIYFYGCQKTPRCTSLEFSAAYHIEGGFRLTDINAWNLKNRYGRGYVDAENDPHMEMDLSLTNSAAVEALGAAIDNWDQVLTSFHATVVCATSPSAAACPTSHGS